MLKHTHHPVICTSSVASGGRTRLKNGSASMGPRHLSVCTSDFSHRRGGAVIIVVLALLSLMIFLGVFFFEFTQEEQLAAQNYAVTNQSLDPEPYFEEALSQLIIGPSASRTMSPLAAGVPGEDDFTAPTSAGISYGTPGTPYSLLAHVIGRMQRTANGLKPTDVIPHNGHGISVQFVDNNLDGVFDPSEYVRFDMDGDGSVDAALDPTDASNLGVPQFGINFSRPAQLDPANDAFSQSTSTNALRPFQPDVEYTYPDINNLFLAYERVDPTTGRRILVPSFHRPDLFPSMRNSGFGDLYTDSTTTRLVMRPHREHRYADNTPGDRSDNVRRYIVNATQAQSGDLNREIQPFPGLNTQSPPVNPVDSDNDGVYNEMGIYSNVSGTEVGYDLDVDLTGDGKPDGIWIDSGYGLIDLPDGRQMVPMFSFHVIDADSLININSAGNLQGVLVNGVDYDSGMPFSVSNTGASASEINVLRALTGQPDSYPLSDMTARQKVFAEHLRIYSSLDISQPISPLTMANMELAFTLGGRIQSRSSARLSGRYGEQKLIGTGTSPAPGITGVDDDLDNTPDSARYQGGAQRTRSIYDPRGGGSVDVVIPYASHPIAPKGTGSSAVTSSGANAGQRVVATAVSGSPVVFPQYPNSSTPTPNSGWETPQSGAVLGTAVPAVSAAYPYPGAPISDPLGSTLFPSGTNGMTDEEDETRLRNPDRIYDDIFRPEENMTFQLSDADRQRMGGNTRAEMIAPFNFKYAHDSQDIRKRFTTDSWDLSELTYVPGRYSSGYTETSEWVSGSGRRFFPPVFSPTLPGVLDGTDPFRPEVRALLATEDTSWTNAFNSRRREDYDFKTAYGGTTPPGLQDDTPLWRQRLNLNKLLVGFDGDGYPIYRDLMPHPDIYETFKTTSSPTITIPPMIHGHNAAIPASASLTYISSGTIEQKVTAQEWWARYDRQRMARDIYTLLYLIGAPDNGANPARDPGSTVYPQAERIREMAQFAVNYVDALDRDDVITKFEYDDDLSNGWSNSPSKHVYGIERASLSFSEVQFLQTRPQTSDFASTLHDDRTDLHQFLHIELRNSSPFRVNLNEGWRISRVQLGTGTIDRSVRFKAKAPNDVKSIGPGENFLLGSHDGTVTNGTSPNILTSDFYADISGGGDLESIIPYNAAGAIGSNSATPSSQTGLDLSVLPGQNAAPYDHEKYYQYFNGSATSTTYPVTTNTKLVRRIQPADLLPPLSLTIPDQVGFDLVLERRQNPHGVGTDDGDEIDDESADSTSSYGDWIEVDRFRVEPSDFGGATNKGEFGPSSGTQAQNQTAMSSLHSLERRQPFDPVQIPYLSSVSRHNTLEVVNLPPASPSSAANSAFSGTSFTLWQPHFDRDLTSAYELLSVPLYGNWPLAELSDAGSTNDGYGTNEFYKEIHGGTQFNLAPGASGSSSGRLSGDFTAGIRFNFPNGIPGRPYQGWNPFNYQNAWYRLFDFVTVPRRADQQSEEIIATVPGSTKPVFRVPGKINLNTLRDETVLAALLDDETHLTYGNATQDYVTAGRNWYQELLQSRDGVDYFAKAAGLPTLAIPNSIDSRPFRNSSKLDPYATSTVDDGVENGLLRSSIFRGATALPPRPNGTAYTTPTLVSPTDFTSTGLGAGTLSYNTNSLNWQGLFDSGDLANTGIDHHTRNRILAKIANNSTTKSHVFFVWTAVGYFEAHEVAAPLPSQPNRKVTQVGARLTDIPIHRRFSVVDMSKLDEAYNTSSNTFDEEAFIIFQKRLR